MREVEQVVVDELIVRAEVVIAADRGPGRIVHPMEIRNAAGVGALGLAEPDPSEAVALDQRIFAHRGARGTVSCPGTRTQWPSRSKHRPW